MLKGVDMTTLGARPCPLLRIGVALVDHLHDQVAVQAHRWFAVDVLFLNGLAHNSPLLAIWRFAVQFDCRIRCCRINNKAGCPLDDHAMIG